MDSGFFTKKDNKKLNNSDRSIAFRNLAEPHFGICTWKCSFTYLLLFERDQQTIKVIDLQLIQTIYLHSIIIPVNY